jgi:hypothetical protein
MIRPFITDEADFLNYARQRARLDEEILRNGRTKVATTDEFMRAECVGQDLEAQRDTIREAMRAYDEKHNGGRRGTWIPLFTGTRYWPESPEPRDIDVRDIAHSLARINRWNGHTWNEFSVAQHSVLVSRLLPGRLKLFGLLHDAGEAFLGDIITPVKRLFRRFYEEFEEATMQCVAAKYGFTMREQEREIVKRADLTLLATEVRDLVPAGYVTQGLTELPMDKPIDACWSPRAAEFMFLNEFEKLTGAVAA